MFSKINGKNYVIEDINPYFFLFIEVFFWCRHRIGKTNCEKQKNAQPFKELNSNWNAFFLNLKKLNPPNHNLSNVKIVLRALTLKELFRRTEGTCINDRGWEHRIFFWKFWKFVIFYFVIRGYMCKNCSKLYLNNYYQYIWTNIHSAEFYFFFWNLTYLNVLWNCKIRVTNMRNFTVGEKCNFLLLLELRKLYFPPIIQ